MFANSLLHASGGDEASERHAVVEEGVACVGLQINFFARLPQVFPITLFSTIIQ